MLENRKVIIDEECKLADCGSAAIAASAAGTVDGVAKVFDTGGGYTDGVIVIDISAITGMAAAASCHTIEICLEGSSTSTFTTHVRLASLKAGQNAAGFEHTRLGGDSTVASIDVGRYIIPFCNDFGGTIYRWLRVYTVFGGTVNEADILFKAYLSKR
jgi:hypothetical protein